LFLIERCLGLEYFAFMIEGFGDVASRFLRGGCRIPNKPSFELEMLTRLRSLFFLLRLLLDLLRNAAVFIMLFLLLGLFFKLCVSKVGWESLRMRLFCGESCL